MKFWKIKRKKKSKSKAAKDTTHKDNDKLKTEAETEENSSASVGVLEDGKKEAIHVEITKSDTSELLQKEIQADVSGDTGPKKDDTIDAALPETAKSTDETKHPTAKKKKERYPQDEESGVFIFGNKINGNIKKLFFALCAITLAPPTFLFVIALLTCILLLLFPLVIVVVMAAFPATVFSFFILMAVLPVLFPAVFIFLLITGKGKLSAFAEGKLLVLRLYRWTLPTI